MDYFAGLDISMDETHVCILDREGEVVRESKTVSTAQAIADELVKAPSCSRIVFETGRMAPILFHGLRELGFPVVCVESRQAYQALKSLSTHKTDRNDARGLAHLARTGFFKPVHVKSLPAHAVRSLIIARKKLVGQRVTLENQIRGLAVVFGVRLPRALIAAFIDLALKASEGIAGLSAAMRGLIAARTAVMTAVAAIDADIRRMTRASGACRRLMTIPGVGQPVRAPAEDSGRRLAASCVPAARRPCDASIIAQELENIRLCRCAVCWAIGTPGRLEVGPVISLPALTVGGASRRPNRARADMESFQKRRQGRLRQPVLDPSKRPLAEIGAPRPDIATIASTSSTPSAVQKGVHFAGRCGRPWPGPTCTGALAAGTRGLGTSESVSVHWLFLGTATTIRPPR
jgi:hypothetical protein